MAESGEPSASRPSEPTPRLLGFPVLEPVAWMARTTLHTIARMPGTRMAIRTAEGLEEVVLGILRERLDRVAPPALGPGRNGAPDSERPARRGSASPARSFARLLDQAYELDPDTVRGRQFERIIASLTPDEARMVAASWGGRDFPVVHVDLVGALGGHGRRVVANVSSIGREATVHARDQAPAYVAHLLDLGLLEYGPVAPDEALEYELLEAEPAVRHAIDDVDSSPLHRIRVVKQSLRMSEFGRQFREACELPADPRGIVTNDVRPDGSIGE